jgi:solute carrier family 25 protein 38
LDIISDEFINISGGVLARVAVGFAMMPITVVKIRYESNLYQYSSIYGAFQSILKKEGIKGLFTGFGATALRDAPFAGIYLFFYENIKQILNQRYQENGVKVNILAGLIGGISATFLTQPFDLIKTKLQLKPQTYKNMAYATKVIYNEGKISGFFAGMGPRLFRKSLSSAISWTVYEEVIRRFNR